MGTRITLLRPGLVEYDHATALQRRTADAVRAGGDETLILLEHPPTYTLGARGNTSNLLESDSVLAARGATVVRSDRGGDVTFHGPGQIVGYPILNLRARAQGPLWYVRRLEETLIAALARWGIDALRVAGRPGVWCGRDKIAAIGVRVSGGVTTHGFALNVNTDLSYFAHIVPCGISDGGVTSMERVLGHQVPFADVEDSVIDAFAACFDIALREPAVAGGADGR